MSDPQQQARLFQAPAEVRQAIYALLVPSIVHVFWRQETLHLSQCVAPSPCRDDTGLERRTTSCVGIEYRDQTWASRLRSLWGPHWKCEQVASSRDGDAGVTPLLLVCKQMYKDVADCLSETSTVHIADIGTLEYLLQTEPKITSSKNVVATIFHSLRKLYVTARLQLQVCKAIEGAIEDSEPKASADLWSRVWPAMTNHLHNLRKLEVEVDHTNRASWSVAHERAITSPLVPLAALPQLKVIVILPKLHPFYERPERHFTADSAGPPFTIIRRTRQQFHAIENPKDEIRPRLVTRSCYDNFPILPAIFALSSVCGQTPEERKEIEEDERARWKSGQDVHSFMQMTASDFECLFCTDGVLIVRSDARPRRVNRRYFSLISQ